jgi:hypothetical protein
MGEEAKAFIVLKPGEKMNAEEIQDYLKTKLASSDTKIC